MNPHPSFPRSGIKTQQIAGQKRPIRLLTSFLRRVSMFPKISSKQTCCIPPLMAATAATPSPTRRRRRLITTSFIRCSTQRAGTQGCKNNNSRSRSSSSSRGPASLRHVRRPGDERAREVSALIPRAPGFCYAPLPPLPPRSSSSNSRTTSSSRQVNPVTGHSPCSRTWRVRQR